jgi:CelD/BcsL family acetyltransferase involved in cellulose biosynthesis
MGPLNAPLVVEQVGSLDELREDWTRLAELDGDLFKTWEWARAWEDTHGAAGRVLLTFRREGGPLVGIARLTFTQRQPRILKFESQGASDQVGPVCAPADRPAVATALRQAVATRYGRPGALLARGLMREQQWTQLLDGVVLQSRPSPMLKLDGLDWPGWLATKSANFRQQVQRRERKLVRDHHLSYGEVKDLDELAAAFERFVAFHDARWQGDSDFFANDGRALHTRFAGLALERGWLRLYVAELEEQPAAFWLGYRFADDYWFFQLARDPQWSRTSIGLVLLAHTVRRSFEEGSVHYRFLSGDHEYKLRFANSDAHHDTVLVAGPWLTRLVRLGVMAKDRAATLRRTEGHDREQAQRSGLEP